MNSSESSGGSKCGDGEGSGGEGSTVRTVPFEVVRTMGKREHSLRFTVDDVEHSDHGCKSNKKVPRVFQGR